MEKYKIKTKSSVKKRFKILANGTIKCGFGNKQHRARQKNSRMLRQKRGSRLLSAMEHILIKRILGGNLK